jgi:hypothetical protein
MKFYGANRQQVRARKIEEVTREMAARFAGTGRGGNLQRESIP